MGLFVSASVAEWIYFSSPVTEKIIVGESFETRDLIFEIIHTKKFWTLTVSNNHVRLFHCKGDHDEEIVDEYFPMRYTEEFMRSAMLSNDLFNLSLNGKIRDFSPRMEDVVNNIINIVRNARRKIVFAGNDELPPFEKIASLLRY